MRLGLALGAGGARGFCHIGVLRALTEQGRAPDAVAGCSMGALVGAAWAGERLDQLEDWARGLTRARFLGYVDIRFSGGGLLQGAAIGDVLQDLHLPDRIEDLPRPFAAVATDLATGREIWLQSGSLVDAVRASVAIPGLVQPHCIDGRYLIDGGASNPVPVSAVRALGAQVIVGVDPNDKKGRDLWQPREGGMIEALGLSGFRDRLPEPLSRLMPEKTERGPDIIEVLDTLIDMATGQLRMVRAATDPPHLMLGADLSHMAVLELFRAGEAIEEGHRLVTEAAADLDRITGTPPNAGA